MAVPPGTIVDVAGVAVKSKLGDEETLTLSNVARARFPKFSAAAVRPT